MKPVIPSIEDALRCAVDTATHQRHEVPNAPGGWILRANAALHDEDEAAMKLAADDILAAHGQYRADFDVKGWLFDLRNAVAATRKH